MRRSTNAFMIVPSLSLELNLQRSRDNAALGVFFSETRVTLTCETSYTNRSFSYEWRFPIGSVVTRFKRGTKS